jgi:S1-C subfamily serine protease
MVVLLGAFVAGVVTTALLLTPFSCGPTTRESSGSGSFVPVAGALPEGLTEDEKNTITVFEAGTRSVVYVVNKTRYRPLFSLDVMEEQRGAGSGFVWDKQGHVVTNFHVLYGGNSFTVVLADQSQYDAEVVGVAPSKELAVLKIDAPAGKLFPVTPGVSSELRVGQKVLAIGNPFGLDQTLTTGTLSALGRQIKSMDGRRTIQNVVQTDAAINPGNSGGPLLDSRGRLVGVNTAIYSPSGANAGIGFAVPVDTVKRVIPMLIKYGKIKRPSLGVEIVPDSIAQRNRINGVIIAVVPPGSAGAQAGLRGLKRGSYGTYIIGDVITGIDGQRVRTSDDLLNILEQHRAGDRVTLTYERDGEEESTTLTLQDLPD